MRRYISFAIVLLLLGISYLPLIAASQHNINPSQPLSSGNILYVGGEGVGNYTKIQDAINDSNHGDTVFVYNGTYYEQLFINKRITIIGESPLITIIDGNESGDIITIRDSFVTIRGFTITNSGYPGVGIAARGNIPPLLQHLEISECVITNTTGGIRFWNIRDSSVTNCYVHNNTYWGFTTTELAHNILISNCTFCFHSYEGQGEGISHFAFGNIEIANCNIHHNSLWGVSLFAHSADIHHNTIYSNQFVGIYIRGFIGRHTISIHDNIIASNNGSDVFDAGIFLEECVAHVLIEYNEFIMNAEYGIYLLRCTRNRIERNNFIENSQHAFGDNSIREQWSSNYWDDWSGDGPKAINGTLLLFIPWTQYDLSPVLEPYDIGGAV